MSPVKEKFFVNWLITDGKERGVEVNRRIRRDKRKHKNRSQKYLELHGVMSSILTGHSATKNTSVICWTVARIWRVNMATLRKIRNRTGNLDVCAVCCSWFE